MKPEALAVDDLVRCPRCWQWHPVIAQPGPASTAYANAMMYVHCGSDLLYVGQAGRPCHHDVTKA
jgi:hypothetical protein